MFVCLFVLGGWGREFRKTKGGGARDSEDGKIRGVQVEAVQTKEGVNGIQRRVGGWMNTRGKGWRHGMGYGDRGIHLSKLGDKDGGMEMRDGDRRRRTETGYGIYR